ncbi:hypothetical protein SAMN04488030_2157 [Aliiroseovarius halocynthiae]|uniref:Uncharacterized protein n=1 Tax=Aliiroseovarius halocynthiae TaxID=985055 RepID=A0A545SXW0_9RHOB|nr:hypothetical protein [Aliiroseovarius halocynthiae]TQV69802.1 hypothetical protein FIL88_01655 [Aliiroseovarius halocynthiae]SMR81730.1 hypothetical protein SAMN04488030_2157 [Aliiroseovarius halocynthiae]
MSFVRTEALTALTRYREALIGAGIILLGLWWAWGSLGLIKWLGVALAGLGVLVLLSGLRRSRIRSAHGGVGVVQIDERQVTYLAPVGGGFASLDDLRLIEIVQDRAGLSVWRFHQPGNVLVIPARAEGAEAIFDALTALSGADIDVAIRAVNTPPADTVVIWGQAVVKLH